MKSSFYIKKSCTNLIHKVHKITVHNVPNSCQLLCDIIQLKINQTAQSFNLHFQYNSNLLAISFQ